jgi:CheY-like chemotaxis protein
MEFVTFNVPYMSSIRNILLADDDKDDSDLFQDVLKELPVPSQLTTVFNGEQLMQYLQSNKAQLPDILFLDLNMPRKNGFECLGELKGDKALLHIPVVIFTTSSEPSVINLLYNAGAQFYIRKPNKIEQLKKLIHLALTLTEEQNGQRSSRDKFVLSLQPVKDETR